MNNIRYANCLQYIESENHMSRKLYFLIFYLVCLMWSFFPYNLSYGSTSDNLVLIPSTSAFIESSSFPSFRDAYNYTLNSNGSKTLVITRNEVIHGLTVIEKGIHIIMAQGASFIKGPSGKLIIAGNFTAPRCQVFKNFLQYEVIFKAGSVTEVYPQWWGAGNGIDSTTAIQAAIHSLDSGGRVYFTKGIYLISKTLLIPSNTALIGEAFADNDADAAVLKLADNVNLDLIRNYSYPQSNAGISIDSLVLLGNKRCNIKGHGLNFKEVDWFYSNKLWVLDFPEKGIVLDTANAVHLDNSRIAFCGNDGLHALGGSSHTYTNLNSEGNTNNGIHISNTSNLSNYSIIGYYSEQCNNGIYINGRGVSILGGRINDSVNADLFLEDNDSVYDISVIGLICQSVKPRVSNVFIGKRVFSTFIFNVFTTSLISNADPSKVRILRQDKYGRLSLNALEFDQYLNTAIKHLGNAGIQFSNHDAFLSIAAEILTLNSSLSVNIRSKEGSINLIPASGATINAVGPLSISSGIQFAPVNATTVPNSSLFLDIDDNNLKYKDRSGRIIPLK